MSSPHLSSLSLFLLFLRFGFLAWGGPVAQIAMLREELVERRKWITPEKFSRALAVYQALPGPEAHELCVYFGMVKKGRWGGFLAGLGFMLPGFLLILPLAWAYKNFGATALLPYCVGFAPAVAALILRALYRMSHHMLFSRSLVIAAGVSVLLTLAKIHFLYAFIICALWQAFWEKGQHKTACALLLVGIVIALGLHWFLPLATAQPHSFGGGLLMQGLQAGLLSFGGAYTALPFLQSGMVGYYDAITPQAFLDGIALTSIIPAPLVIFGTYLGFLADGFTGALLMTLGIFIPAFSFTLLGHNMLERLIEKPALHGLLDGMSAAVVGLLGVTAVEIALPLLATPEKAVLLILSLVGFFLLRGIWATPAIILSSGILGYILLP